MIRPALHLPQVLFLRDVFNYCVGPGRQAGLDQVLACMASGWFRFLLEACFPNPEA